ncbi:CGNR zinc finger domain-containing protein [Microbacterium sp.]|uniref:CGNR zinc finger domain-containing protein n=1 Tax=Microbacterium sp. TaxID=51671 RepID=UPI003A872E4A
MNLDPPTGQWFVAGDGQRWWFDSGSIAFDFAYTGGFPGPPEWEYWREPQDVAKWWRERFGVDVPVSAADYAQARELRKMIAQAVIAAAYDRMVPDESAATIDEWAARPDMPPQLRAEPPVSSDRLLATIARSAVAALRQTERVRVCGADDCVVMYLDTSHSGNRAWCSMRRCGNRHKVRALRARRAASGTTNDPQQQPRQENNS